MRIKTTSSCFLAAALVAGAHPQRLLQENDSPTAAPQTNTSPPDAAVSPTTAPLPQPIAPPPTNVPSAFVAPAPTSPPTNLPTSIISTYSYASVGCYVDDAYDRVLTGSSVKGVEAMTTEECAAFCEGFAYFGTEYSNEWFCGNSSDEPTRLGETTCAFPCSGNADQICGDRDAMNLYEYTPPYTYLGCFADDRGGRVLSGGFTTDPDMTPQLCSTICEASNLRFGLEYGVECYCGLPSDDYDQLGLATCDYPCAGDTSETCGGFHAVSVYEYAVVDPVPPTYLGCWGDSREGRIMQSVQSDNGMTTDQCQAICRDNPNFGLQYGFECWCGDDTTDYETYGPTVCSHACPGNADEICGGNFAMSVWEH